MTDRELLENAAKAAGMPAYEVAGYHPKAGLVWVSHEEGQRKEKCWNPLLDDGDALRLAVKLYISVKHPDPRDLGGGYVTASICEPRYRYYPLKKTWFNVVAGSEECPGDLCAAARLAVVRAAAEIGKARP